MPTLTQIIKKKFRQKIVSKHKHLLFKKPQRLGICQKILIKTPKKPNSALRKVAKILIDKKEITAYIPGEGFALQEHNFALIKGGKIRDLPGVNYKIIRGAKEVNGVKNRKTSRSKYGVKKS